MSVRVLPWGEVPLFEWPEAGSRPRPALRAQAPAARFTRFRPRTRTLCAECIREIHRLGPGVAPLPRPVRWHLHRGALTEAICEKHKTELEQEL